MTQTQTYFSATFVIAIVAASALGGTVTGAELRFRPTASPTGPVVTLGDVAEIVSADPQEVRSLAAVSLFPMPVEGKTAYVEEILETLELRGVAVRELDVVGSRVVAVRPTHATIAARRFAGDGSPTSYLATKPGTYVAPVSNATAVLEPQRPTADERTPSWINRAREREDAAAAILVHRSDVVEATVTAGSVTVTTRGVAESEGKLGERVLLRSFDRKRSFDGVVVGSRTVRVGGQTP